MWHGRWDKIDMVKNNTGEEDKVYLSIKEVGCNFK